MAQVELPHELRLAFCNCDRDTDPNLRLILMPLAYSFKNDLNSLNLIQGFSNHFDTEHDEVIRRKGNDGNRVIFNCLS